MKLNEMLFGILGVLISVFAIVYILWIYKNVILQAFTVDPHIFVIGLVVYLLSYLPWYFRLKILSQSESWRILVALFGGLFFNNYLPGRLGEVFRAIFIKERIRDGIKVVVKDRLLDIVFLLAVATIFLVTRQAYLAALGGFATILLFVSFLKKYYDKVISLSLYTFSIWFFEAATFHFFSGGKIGIIESIVLISILNLFTFVPSAPGYLGTYEAGTLFAAKVSMIGEDIALVAAVRTHMIHYLAALLGGVLILYFWKDVTSYWKKEKIYRVKKMLGKERLRVVLSVLKVKKRF